MNSRFKQHWYKKPELTPLWLKWLSAVSRFYNRLRHIGYNLLFFRIYRAPLPVIAIGNASVEGRASTEMVAWLTMVLKKKGLHPGIVKDGIGGNATVWPQQVRPDSDSYVVGGRALRIARLCQCPMAVGSDMAQAAKALVRQRKVDVIIAFGALNYPNLSRDIEIALLDEKSTLGNGLAYPYGPNLASLRRLEGVDFRVVINGQAQPHEFSLEVKLKHAVNVKSPRTTANFDEFKAKKVHLVADELGLAMLKKPLNDTGIKPIEHNLSEGFEVTESSFEDNDNNVVLMEEKDAVECERFAKANFWFLRTITEVDAELEKQVLALVEKKLANRKQKWITSYSTS